MPDHCPDCTAPLTNPRACGCGWRQAWMPESPNPAPSTPETHTYSKEFQRFYFKWVQAMIKGEFRSPPETFASDEALEQAVLTWGRNGSQGDRHVG
ncbi:MAG: hypothetical protein HQL56_18345 [Magnetococcales bacterium]|nr:hypothetical protein [Magnetococcales bacterium]